MTTIIAIQRSIRRALQKQLYNAVEAFPLVDEDGAPLLQWAGVHFERVNRTHFIAAEFAFSHVEVLEIGPNPMVEANGHITMNLHSPLDEGADGNDALLGIIEAAYPYASTPSFEGVTVNIDKTEPRGYGNDGPWMTGLYSTRWNIYRRD